MLAIICKWKGWKDPQIFFLSLFQSAEQLFDQMVRRFSLNKDVWISYGLFEFKMSKAEMARKVMQRSLKSLDKRDRKLSHVILSLLSA